MKFTDCTIMALRTLTAKGRRNPLKILSLGIGLAVGLVLTSKVCFETTFDSCYPSPERLYYINETAELNGVYTVYPEVSGGIAPCMKEYFPEIEAATRFTPFANNASIALTGGGQAAGRRLTAEYIILADTSYFDIFGRGCVAGDIRQSLDVEGQAVVCASLARKIATTKNAEDAVGQKFVIKGHYAEDYELTVAGVYEDFPLNATWRPEIAVSMPSIGHYIWDGSHNMVGNDRYKAIVRLAKGADVESLHGRMSDFMEKYLPMEEVRSTGFDLSLIAKPIAQLHNNDQTSRNMTLLLALTAFALLLTSALNYLLIVLSTSATRTREMALRKCLGCGRSGIAGIMTAEALVHTLLGALIAAALVLVFRHPIENILGVEIGALFTGRPLLAAVAVLLALFAANSIAPSLYFARTPVATAFRGYRAQRRSWKLALLAVEFAAVVFLSSVMCIISLQYRKMTRADLGFDCDRLAMVYLPEATEAQKLSLISDIRALGAAEEACLSVTQPFELLSGNNTSLPGESEQLFNIQDAYHVDDHYLSTMGIRLLRGSNFDPTQPHDAEVLVDERFAEKMRTLKGWDDVVGREVFVTSHGRLSRICGVIADMQTGTFEKALTQSNQRPMCIFYCNPEEFSATFNYIFVRYKAITPEALKATSDILAKTLGEQSYSLDVCSSLVRDSYSETLSTRNAIMAGGAVALLIALFGLIGYTMDEVRRRSKEIAVRRISGASFSQIRAMFQRDILLITIPSAVAGAALAAVAMGRWEQNFTLQAGLPAWVFIGSALAAVALVAAVSDLYVRFSAQRNPAESIKTE